MAKDGGPFRRPLAKLWPCWANHDAQRLSLSIDIDELTTGLDPELEKVYFPCSFLFTIYSEELCIRDDCRRSRECFFLPPILRSSSCGLLGIGVDSPCFQLSLAKVSRRIPRYPPISVKIHHQIIAKTGTNVGCTACSSHGIRCECQRIDAPWLVLGSSGTIDSPQVGGITAERRSELLNDLPTSNRTGLERKWTGRFAETTTRPTTRQNHNSRSPKSNRGTIQHDGMPVDATNEGPPVMSVYLEKCLHMRTNRPGGKQINTTRDNEHSRNPKPERSRTVPPEAYTMPDYVKTRSDITQALIEVSRRFQWDIDILALPEPDIVPASPLVPTVVTNTTCNHDPEVLGIPWILNSQSAYAKSWLNQSSSKPLVLCDVIWKISCRCLWVT